MKTQRSDPNASALMESTRSIGYNFNSALADIIDNSLAKNSRNVWIYSPPDKIQVSILDDGDGMDREMLLEAMRYGSDPNEERDPNDLGRFGLLGGLVSLDGRVDRDPFFVAGPRRTRDDDDFSFAFSRLFHNRIFWLSFLEIGVSGFDGQFNVQGADEVGRIVLQQPRGGIAGLRIPAGERMVHVGDDLVAGVVSGDDLE